MVDVGPLRANGSQSPFSPGDDVPGGAAAAGIVGGVAVVLDITARRHADLLSPAARGGDFEEVFERAPIGTALLDGDGRWLLVNRALCEITGYTADELVGKRFDGIVHPEDADNDSEQRQRLLAGRDPRLPGREALSSTPPVRWSRRSCRCRSCATRRGSRCTTSPSCRTSPSASAWRNICATSPTTTR